MKSGDRVVSDGEFGVIDEPEECSGSGVVCADEGFSFASDGIARRGLLGGLTFKSLTSSIISVDQRL